MCPGVCSSGAGPAPAKQTRPDDQKASALVAADRTRRCEAVSLCRLEPGGGDRLVERLLQVADEVVRMLDPD